MSTTDETKTQSGDDNSMLKKSGVEILGQEENLVDIGPHDSAEKLKNAFETELGATPTLNHPQNSTLAESIRHLEEAHTKLAHEEKVLGDETAKDIEALKKTKATIEEKIARLKEIEQKEKTIQTELAEAKDLEAREKKLKEDADRISRDTI